MVDGIKSRSLLVNPYENNKRAASFTNTVASAAGVEKDSASISYEALKIRQELMMLNTLTSIKGQPIQDLVVKDNVLTLEAGAYYRFLISGDQYMIITGRGGVISDVPFDHIAEECFNSDSTYFSEGTYKVFERMQLFFTALNQKSTWFLRTEFTKEEVLSNCAKLGIKAGDWVEVNNAGEVNRFYLCENGTPWPEGQIEHNIFSFSVKDWRQDGCTADSVFLINGKEYKMDENGHINIPKGEPVIWGYNVTLPKEIAENLRRINGIPEPVSNNQAT